MTYDEIMKALESEDQKYVELDTKTYTQLILSTTCIMNTLTDSEGLMKANRVLDRLMNRINITVIDLDNEIVKINL